MKTKKIKVLYSSRTRLGDSWYSTSRYIETPKISMEGKWLEALGFHIGDQLQVDYTEGEIRIRLAGASVPAMVCEPETEYAAPSRQKSSAEK